MKKCFLKFIILTSFFFSAAEAQNLFPLLGGQRIGTAAVTFLKIDVGAKATAMSGASVANADDASSLYWNPASSAFIPDNTVSVSHIEWPVEIQYEYLSYVHHFSGFGTLGLSTGYLHMEDMEVTTEYHPTGTGEYFQYYDAFASVTYSLKMTDRFSFGTSVKYVEENLAGLKMGGWLLDLGTFYWTGFRSLRFAVSVVNFGQDLKPSGSFLKRSREGNYVQSNYESFSPPTTFRVGSAMEVIDNNEYTLTTSVQINHPVDNAENAVLGLEFGYIKKLFLRAGYRINYDEEKFTFGAGVQVPVASTRLVIDYAFKQFKTLGKTNQFSLGYHF